MTKRMLIDATHAEETRVVVLDGNRLEDFDVETSTKRQLKGNIYLAKVVRVEPSLQAAFVEYGGNRHGFLAFSEIHPDYYQIPVADRQRLIDQEAEEAQREEEEVDRELAGDPHPATPAEPPPETAPEAAPVETGDASGATAEMLRDTIPEPRGDAASPPSDTGDSIAGAPPPGFAGSLAGTTATDLVEHTAAPTSVPAGELGDRVTGAAALALAGALPEPADPAASPAGTVATDLPAEAAPSPAAATAQAPVEAPPPEQAPSQQAPSEHATSQRAASEQTAPEQTAPVQAASEHGASEHGEESDPPARRAQPLVIEPETLSGPVETGTAAGDPDTFTMAGPADAASEADTEHDPDLPYDDAESIPESLPPETVGGEPDGADEHRERRMPSRYLRNYKIQEVIRRRQILLVQVVKEERGTKGAALTTYLSLAGRFSVLMPNSPRGGGISRKITSVSDRRRLKEVVSELEMPKGMGIIVRTAGANRPKPEIKRDCEYLLRLWDDIREHTLKSVAPALIYEEASLIKRAIRDVYSRDIDEIQVDGEEGWRAAHEFMRMLMPSHAKKVQLWRDPSQPLFTKYQVEAQLDGMLQPTVQLRSGGYLVINQTEALVAIDVNSGRSTRERNVEETALRTNMEAADEVARQLRLRDLAGLVVIDFIDMEAKKHNAMVERRIKEALKNDRARIQLGHISHFGLLEMSRQRLRPSLAEASFILCPHCGGTGHVRSTENAAIHVLRGIEDEGSKHRSAEIVAHMATPIALYILNHKRDRLREIELRYAMRVTVLGDDTQVASQFRIDRMRPQVAREDTLAAITPDAPQPALPAPRFEPDEAAEVLVEVDESDAEASARDQSGGDESAGDESGADEDGAEEAGGETARAAGTETAAEQAERRRRRRRRRGGRHEDGTQSPPAEAASDAAPPETETAAAFGQVTREPGGAAAEEDISGTETHIEGVPEHAEPAADDDARRRRGRRGGRRRRREPGDGDASPFAAPGAEQPDLLPVYAGPTPANPFGGQAFDIFDVLEQVEASAAVRLEPAGAATRQPEAPAAPQAMTAPAEPAMAEPPVSEIVNTGAPQAMAASVEPVMAEPDAPDAAEIGGTDAPEIVNTGAPEPASADSVAEPAVAEPAPPEEAAPAVPTADAIPPDAANDAAPEPAIRPILIGSGAESVEKKRGWWRR
ncbi:MAG TPA: Rne/Rng family ribonuclease [Acetobacteraceae bacterium]|nr:Rne/Rng family ribonuclease [Acetobacteraceae bacterium]